MDTNGACDILVTLTATALVTFCLVFGLTAVLFEQHFTKSMQELSYTLTHNRNKRNLVVFATFLATCIAAALSVVSLNLISRLLRRNPVNRDSDFTLLYSEFTSEMGAGSVLHKAIFTCNAVNN